jgi:hypothetical protein
MRKRLVDHVERLSHKIGERNAGESWQLAEAADYIAGELTDMGFALERHGYETEDVAAQNLSVTVPGGVRGDQILLVGVHYDSPIDSPGWAGAVDVALALELARLMRKAETLRSLRFTFFSMGESPHGDGEARGARQYLRSVDTARKRSSSPGFAPETLGTYATTIGFVSLDRTGDLRAERNAGGSLATRVGLTSSPGSEAIRQPLVEGLSGDGVQREDFSFERFLLDHGDSDAQVFHSAGVPVVVIQGKAPVDGPESGGDLVETARIGMRLRWAIGQIVGEKMGNDAMLTPSGLVLR